MWNQKGWRRIAHIKTQVAQRLANHGHGPLFPDILRPAHGQVNVATSWDCIKNS